MALFFSFFVFDYKNWQTPPLIKVFDITGKLIQTAIMKENNFQMSLPSLMNGLYFYQIIREDGGLIASGKVVKNDIGF